MHDGSALEARALAFIEQIQPLTAPEAVIAAFRSEAGQFGFSTFALGELPLPGSVDLPPFFISTWPDDWAEAYVGEGLVAGDPTLTFARNEAMPASWSELVARYGRANTRIFDTTATHGWPDGLVIPVHGPRGYRGVVSLAGETRDLPLRDRATLHLMSLYLHQRLRDLMAPDLAKPADEPPPLSPGEIECIMWLIAGKTDWEMSEILNIAEATAHWRIERAKKKFGVKTRAQLTAMAVHHGYVRP